MRLSKSQLASHPKLAKLVGIKETEITQPKRVRQSEKPLMNKLEEEWYHRLAHDSIVRHLRAQAVRFKLGNGAWYKPDITGLWSPDGFGGVYKQTAWEVKGGRGMKGNAKSMLTLKVAAALWPEVRFILVWKENGEFKTQEILA